MEMTGGLDNSERESGTQRVRGLGKKLETTRSLRDCGSLTASLSLLSPSLPLCSSLKHLHASTSVTSVTFELSQLRGLTGTVWSAGIRTVVCFFYLLAQLQHLRIEPTD